MNYPGIMLATDHTPLPFSRHDADRQQRAVPRRRRVLGTRTQEFRRDHRCSASHEGRSPASPSATPSIVDSTYDGIQFKTGGGSMPNVAITNVRIDKSNNGAGILAMSGARGSATLSNVTITNSADGNIVIQPGSQFITGS